MSHDQGGHEKVWIDLSIKNKQTNSFLCVVVEPRASWMPVKITRTDPHVQAWDTSSLGCRMSCSVLLTGDTGHTNPFAMAQTPLWLSSAYWVEQWEIVLQRSRKLFISRTLTPLDLRFPCLPMGFLSSPLWRAPLCCQPDPPPHCLPPTRSGEMRRWGGRALGRSKSLPLLNSVSNMDLIDWTHSRMDTFCTGCQEDKGRVGLLLFSQKWTLIALGSSGTCFPGSFICFTL